MNTKHQTQAIEKQAQAIREIREEMVSELNELEGMNMRNRNDDPVCPQCGNTVEEVHHETGICEHCMETPDQRAARLVDEAQDAFDSGRPMSDWDR